MKPPWLTHIFLERGDWTLPSRRTTQPFSQRLCLLAATVRKHLWVAPNPWTWVPGTNKAKLGHSSCIIFRAELAKSPEAYIPQSLYWKLKSEFLLCFLKKIYLSVPTYLFTNSSSNFPPPQKGREKRRSHINDKVSLSKILPCEPCCKSSLAESTILHRAHLYSSLLPPPPSFLFNLSVQN